MFCNFLYCRGESPVFSLNTSPIIEFFNCQDVEDETEYGLNIIEKFAKTASGYRREEVDFSELCIGLKCGGSDGYSGLTANPPVLPVRKVRQRRPNSVRLSVEIKRRPPRKRGGRRFGSPTETRTPDSALRGRRLNRLTMRPFFRFAERTFVF